MRIVVKAVSVIFALLVVFAGALVWVELNREIRSVRVDGELTVAEQLEIRRAVASSLGPGLLGIDLATVRNDIQELSWPRTVTIRRRWPAGLDIQVEKDHAVAAWGDEGFLTSDGRVIQFPDEPEGLPGFRCARSQPLQAMEVFGLLRKTLEGTELQISTLRESALGEWEVELDVGVRVVLGRHSLVERMRRFRLVHERVLQHRLSTVVYVDARYANGIAVRWEEALAAYEGNPRYDI
ncbi:MAG: FtsQ-type POTRA domain-containing protein [Pseudomonadales bacterium]|jgi:cell division protein FtsQ